jgi:hypothetical protein
MSTRCTIAYDQKDFHLYQECFESDNVYLKLDGAGWDASLDTAPIDWRDGDVNRPSLKVRIDVTLWRRIVEGWLESQWAKDPSVDHAKHDFDPEAALKWIEKYKENKRDE